MMMMKDDNEFLNIEMMMMKDDNEFLNIGLPLGFRFRPSPQEIIVNYLMKKINNQVLPPNSIIQVRLYDFTPDQLAERFKASGNEKEWYFFTPTKRKHKTGNFVNRVAGDGYWKAVGKRISIKHNGEEIGFERRLAFYRGKPPHGVKTDWLMHEFRLKDARPPPRAATITLEDWVVCKLYKTPRIRTSKTNEEVKLPSSPADPKLLVEGSSSRFSSDVVGRSSFAYDHPCLQGLPFASGSVKGMAAYHFQIPSSSHSASDCQEFPSESSHQISGQSVCARGVRLLSSPYHPDSAYDNGTRSLQ